MSCKATQMRPLELHARVEIDSHLNKIIFRLCLYDNVFLLEMHVDGTRSCVRGLPQPLWSWLPKMAAAR